MRNKNQQPLSETQMRSLVPSAYAIQPYEKMSDRYAFIPTSRVIDALAQAGYQPTEAHQAMVRREGGANYAKHLIRFSSRSFNPTTVGESALELVMINSHDGSSRYKFMLGVIVFACTNGLIVNDGLVGSINVRHSGNIVDDVLEASTKLVQEAPKVEAVITEWKSLKLTTPEAELFAETVLQVRYDGEAVPVRPSDVLRVRHYEQREDTLWNVFNRVQENVIQGGIVPRDSYGRRLRDPLSYRAIPRTRGVRGINENLNLNRAIFELAQKFASLKKGE